ncbi:MAG: hypothetical protein AAB945_00405 [Patescibacteria group bacterium]
MKILYKIKKLSLFSNQGFLTVEVLIAISIITISILASMTVAQKSIYVSRQSLHFSQANFLLEEGAEAVRILRDNAWTNISSLTLETYYYPLFSNGTWSLSTTPNTVGIFTRKMTISSVKRDDTSKDISDTGTVDTGTKLVTITVSWSESGTTVTKTLSFYILDIFS